MQKKILLGITAVVLLFVLALTGCEQPLDQTITNKTELQSLPAPADVKAVAYNQTGTIRVTWEPVINASGYVIYRKSLAPANQGGESYFKRIASVSRTASYLGFDDVINFDNEFKNEVAYTYKVVALSDLAWLDGAGSNTGGLVEVDAIVLNSGQDSNTVKFTAAGNEANPVLAQGETLGAPADLAVKQLVNYANTGALQENLQVTWSTIPGVNYLVRYSIGDGLAAEYVQTNFYQRITNVAIGQTTSSYTFPIINGATTVQVIAQPKSAGYYVDSTPAAETQTITKKVLPAPAGFTAAAANGKVTLNWNKVDGAAAYKVYRFTGNGSYTGGTFIFSAWEEVTESIDAELIGNQYTAYDFVQTVSTENLVYMIIAANTATGASSLPAVANTTNPFTGPSTLSQQIIPFDSLINEWRGILLNWLTAPGETYKLYRAAILLDNNAAIAGPEGGIWTYQEVTAPINVAGDGRAAVIDKPDLRKSYRYKLVTTKGGKEATIYANVIGTGANPYQSGRVGVSLTADNTPPLPTTGNGRGSAYAIGLTIGNVEALRAQLKDGEYVRISRAPTANAGATAVELGPYEVVETISKAALSSAAKVNVTGPGYFKYRAEVVSGATAGAAVIRNGVAGPNALAPSAPTIGSLGTVNIGHPSAGTSRIEIDGISQGVDRLNNLLLVVRVAKDTSPGNAATEYANGNYTETFVTLSWHTTDSKYYANVPTPSYVAGEWFAEVFYKEETYLSGEPTVLLPGAVF